MKINNLLLADIPIGPGGGFKPPVDPSSPLANPSQGPVTTVSKVISTFIGFITIIAFIYFTFNLITGALSVITAGSDKGSVEQARKKITNSLIGLVATISALFLIRLLENVFKIDILNLQGLVYSIIP